MKIVNLLDRELASYCRNQIQHFFPTGEDCELQLIVTHLEEALYRLERCISQVRMWPVGQFDVLHSSQYCTFLYYLSNTIWHREQAKSVCTKLFLLNKALNSIDCFYEIELPEVFLIGHSSGIVLAKATYGNRMVIYQNSTVGKNHGISPVLEDSVILYPNTAVIGNSLVRSGSIIASGVSVINQSTEAHKIAFQGNGKNLIFVKSHRNILSDFFRTI
jgi:serine O-acetyltransferase